MTKDYIYCTQCGTKNKTGNQFCTECRNNLHKRMAADDRPDEEIIAPEQSTIEELPEEISKVGMNKKLVGILSVLLVVVAAAFVYTQGSDGTFNPFASKEEIWVIETDETDEDIGFTYAVKIIDNEEAWFMESYHAGYSDTGMSNVIYSLGDDSDSERDGAIRLKSQELKTVELVRASPFFWISEEVYAFPIEFELFDIEYDSLETSGEYFGEVLEGYLEDQTFSEIVKNYDSFNEYLEKKEGTKEVNKIRFSEILIEYIDEDFDHDRMEEFLALRTELAEAVIKENTERIKEKVQVVQLEMEKENKETGLASAEPEELENEMRADGLEYDDYRVEPSFYFDEEKLNLVMGVTNLSKSAQYHYHQSRDGSVFIFEKLPVEHPDNGYDEEILVVYLENDKDDKMIFFKED